MADKAEVITLDAEGMDTQGCRWVPFTVDYLAEQTDGECSICGATLSEGYLCMDDASEEVCDAHVTTVE